MEAARLLRNNAPSYACMQANCSANVTHEVSTRISSECIRVSRFPACRGDSAAHKWKNSLLKCSKTLSASSIVGHVNLERSQLDNASAEKKLLVSPMWGNKLGCQCSKRILQKRRVTSAAWQENAPYVAAIGVAIAASAVPLVFPVPWSVKAAVDDKKRFNEFNTFGSEDTKFNVMSLIAFLPLFNWLAWILAWLDSGDVRYALYAAAYLAPWVKSGLSFTDDWLPLTALALGAVHVQLERYVQSEGPVQSLPGNTEQPVQPEEEKKTLPGGKFDDRGWAATIRQEDLAKLKLSEEEIRRREQKWELKRWDDQFAERLKAELAAEEALSSKAED